VVYNGELTLFSTRENTVYTGYYTGKLLLYFAGDRFISHRISFV